MCIFYYLFCCFLCRRKRRQEEYTGETPGASGTNSRPNFVKEFKRQIKRLRHKKFQGEEILNAIVRLYRNKNDAVERLGHVRLNPDFTSKKGKDGLCLEFFIPQLCSFYL
jgi:hypothetical protein